MRKQRLTNLAYFIGGGLTFGILIWFFPYQYELHADYSINRYKNKLETLAKQSLVSKDVPVASLVIYVDNIIGEGFNTVYRDSNPAGHAEINAIEDAIRKIGFKEFKVLDRDKLFLVSTFEPCSMCKGAIEEYNILHTVFDLSKSGTEKIQSFKKNVKYYKYQQETGDGRLQYDLFKLHPDFDSTKYEF